MGCVELIRNVSIAGDLMKQSSDVERYANTVLQNPEGKVSCLSCRVLLCVTSKKKQ